MFAKFSALVLAAAATVSMSQAHAFATPAATTPCVPVVPVCGAGFELVYDIGYGAYTCVVTTEIPSWQSGGSAGGN